MVDEKTEEWVVEKKDGLLRKEMKNKKQGSDEG